jgi:hypothetical protein
MAGRKGIWIAQADRSDPPGEAARTAQRRLAVRLQLRSPQPHAAAETDCPWTTGKARGVVRLKADGEPETTLHNASQPHKDSRNRRFQPISPKPRQQSPANSRHVDEVQQVLRSYAVVPAFLRSV